MRTKFDVEDAGFIEAGGEVLKDDGGMTVMGCGSIRRGGRVVELEGAEEERHPLGESGVLRVGCFIEGDFAGGARFDYERAGLIGEDAITEGRGHVSQ